MSTSILISGVLVNPFNRPLPNAIITLTSISNSFTVLTGANVTARTNDAGEYELHVQPGNYAVYVAKDSYRDFYGAITLTATTPPTTLNVLLKQNAMEAELPPDLVEFFQQVQNQVVVVGNGADEAARIATEKAGAAAISEQNAGTHSVVAVGAASSAVESAATAEEIASKLGDLEQLIRDAGYAPVDSFEKGATLTSIGQALRHESTGIFYSWRGQYEKVVPPGSTPESTGGISQTAWVDVNDITFRSQAAAPDGTQLMGAPLSGNLLQMLYWTTPEQFGAVGDGVANDTIAVTKSIMTGRCAMRRGAAYRMVMTESNVITPPSGAIIDFNGALITHEKMGFLVFLNKNTDVTILNFSGVYKGTYPTSAIPTTRYGISRPHEAAFTGFIGMQGNAYRFNVSRSKVIGATPDNKYDFFISGFEGDFRGSLFSGIYGSHYSCLLANNFHNTTIEHVFGTLRHADSIAVYGPSHMMYVGVNGGTIRKVREFGSLLSNLLSGAEATIQVTAGTDTLIEDVTTTMDNVGAIAYKADGDALTLRKIVSRSNFTITKNTRLFEIQTNLQAYIQNAVIDDVKIFLPAGNLQASAFWCGGSRTSARKVFIDVPYTVSPRQSEIAFLVTSNYADVELDVRSSMSDSIILLSAFNTSKLKLSALNNPVTYKSNYSISGSGWGECSGSTIETVDNLDSTRQSVISVNSSTRLNCNFFFGGAVNGESYGQIVNQSSTTNITKSILIGMPPLNPGLSFHNILTYEIEVNCTSLNAGQALYAKYVLFVSSNGSLISGTFRQITNQQLGAINIASDVAFNPVSGYLTATCTRQPNGENLRSLIVRSRLINTKPYFSTESL